MRTARSVVLPFARFDVSCQLENCLAKSLLRRVAGAGFDFFDLLGVALAVRANQQNKFVSIPLAVCAWTVNGMAAQVWSLLQKILGGGAALYEMFHSGLR
jgi:hypothetical protein